MTRARQPPFSPETRVPTIMTIVRWYRWPSGGSGDGDCSSGVGGGDAGDNSRRHAGGTGATTNLVLPAADGVPLS